MNVRPLPDSSALTGKQARYLRALGHGLSPGVVVGKEGASDAVVVSLEENLTAHELVKVRVGQGCPDDRREVARVLASRTGARVAQVLGRTVLLYRPGEKAKIILP